MLFRKLGFAIFCSLSLIPLVFSKQSTFGMSVPRVLTFWTIVVIVSFLALATFWKKNSFKLHYSKLSIALISYFVILVVSGSFAESRYLSYFSTFERMDGVVNYFFLILFYLIFSNFSFNSSQWSIFAKLTSFIALLISLITIYQHFTQPLVRSESTFGNPLTLAFYLQVHIFLVLIFIANLNNSIGRKKVLFFILAFVVSLVYIFAIYCTGSRSSFVSLTIGVAFFFSLLFWKKHTYRKGIFISVILIIGSVFLFISHFRYLNLTKRIIDLSFTDNSSQSRIELWKISLKHFYENPILGWGKDNFIYFFSKYYTNNLVASGEWYDHSHNFLIDKLVETGVVGLFFYLVFLVLTFWCLIQCKIPIVQKAGLLALFVSYILYHFANFENFPSNLFLFIFLIYIFQNMEKKAAFEIKLNKIKVVTSALFLSIFSYFFIWKTYKTYSHLNRINLGTISPQNINFAFEEAIIGKYDLGIKYAILRTEINKSPEDQRKEILDQVIFQNKELLKKYPSHPILLSQLGFLFLASGNLSEAINTYKSLKKIAPNRHINLMDLGMFYLRNKQFGEALEQFSEVFKMDETYKLALISKAYCYSAQGDIVNSNKILDSLEYLTIIENLDKCTDLYRINNNYGGLLKKLSNYNLVGVSGVTPNSFLRRVQLAVLLGEKSEVKKAVYSYLKYFFLKYDQRDVDELISNIQTGKLPPEAFYKKFENDIWW